MKTMNNDKTEKAGATYPASTAAYQEEHLSELDASDCSRMVFEAMEELDRATDTRWWSDYETCFDRMAALYIEMGGDDKLLRDRWPESF